jgi:cellulose synthase operon protein YhjU
MGAWSLYFLVKVGLYFAHKIGLHWFWNIAFAVALAWPLERLAARRLRLALAIPIAVALLYYDSYLPAWSRVLDQIDVLSNFRLEYLEELAQRFVDPLWVGLIALFAVAYALTAHRLRYATLAFVSLLAAALLPAPGVSNAPVPDAQFVRAGETPAAQPIDPEVSKAQLDAVLASDYASEHGKIVNFSKAGPARFDLIILSVCSLASDDLDYERMQNSTLLKRFDIVFRQFNSGATYSGPAVLRLLHGTCGQTRQGELYSGTASDSCYLFRNLAAAGYQPALLMNHDGHFDNFATQLQTQGGINQPPLDNRYAPALMTAFDGTPIREDYDVLSQWWKSHAKGDDHPALLYNTISLHDGNLMPGAGRGMASYGPRLNRLFSDLDRFLDLVAAGSRPTVVVLIPEHGAALRGDALQIPGLRELPTMAITRVPAAVKLIGFPQVTGTRLGPIVVEKPSSYLALTALVAGLSSASPTSTTRDAVRALAAALPSSPWIAENEGTVLLRHEGYAYLRSTNGQWSLFDPGPRS